MSNVQNTPAAPTPPSLHDPITPPSVLLMGEAGSGKTWSLASLIEAGLEVFVVSTEPNGLDSLLDALASKKLPVDKLHWHTVQPILSGWDAMLDLTKKVGSYSYADLVSFTKNGISKDQTQLRWIELLKTFKNFTDERTRKDFGDVTMFSSECALVIDSLTGINELAKQLVIGLRPTLHEGEWNVAMETIRNLIWKLTSDRHCYLVVTAHIEREVEENTQSTKLTLSTLGRKLAPKLLPLFSEIVLAKRVQKDFFWSTSEAQTTVKNRALPISETLPPSFVGLVKSHQARVAAIHKAGGST